MNFCFTETIRHSVRSFHVQPNTQSKKPRWTFWSQNKALPWPSSQAKHWNQMHRLQIRTRYRLIMLYKKLKWTYLNDKTYTKFKKKIIFLSPLIVKHRLSILYIPSRMVYHRVLGSAMVIASGKRRMTVFNPASRTIFCPCDYIVNHFSRYLLFNSDSW